MLRIDQINGKRGIDGRVYLKRNWSGRYRVGKKRAIAGGRRREVVSKVWVGRLGQA
jgi:hypothetical protein